MTTTAARRRADDAEPIEPSPTRARRREIVLYSVLGAVAIVAGGLGVLASLI